MFHPPTDVTGARSKSELAPDIWLVDEADFTSFLPHIPGSREHVQLVGG